MKNHVEKVGDLEKWTSRLKEIADHLALISGGFGNESDKQGLIEELLEINKKIRVLGGNLKKPNGLPQEKIIISC